MIQYMGQIFSTIWQFFQIPFTETGMTFADLYIGMVIVTVGIWAIRKMVQADD